MGSELEPRETSFTESVLGTGYLQWGWVKRIAAWPATYRVAAIMAALAALVFVPYLGAVGLWDPWETHYGEVAREMIQRNDYVYPFWENAWFFSKPAFTMWMQALGMQIAGTLRTEGALALYTEWAFRLPFALFSIAAVTLLGVAVSRVVNRRAGYAVVFVLVTMPMYFLLTRQAVTDTPFVTTMVAAMACALIGQLDDSTRHRAGWWYAFYVLCGFSTLAKGLLGVGLPAVVLILYAALAVIPWSWEAAGAHFRWLTEGAYRKSVTVGEVPMPALWAQLYKMRFGTGVAVFALVAVPWYLTLSLFEGVDDESKTFFYRFFIHDHLNRLGAGVHTTTPGGDFTYFIEQGGYAIYPWVALVPGAIAIASRIKIRSLDNADHLGLIAVLWLAFTYALLGSSATKFHHYVFPMLPPLAVLIALFVDRLWVEGVAAHGVSLIFGLVLFILVGKDLAGNPKNFTDLFVYNYDRPYPVELVQDPLNLPDLLKPLAWIPGLVSNRRLWTGDVLSLVLVGLGGYLLIDAFLSRKAKQDQASASVSRRALAVGVASVGVALLIVMGGRGQISATLALGCSLLVVAVFLSWASTRSAGGVKGPVGTAGMAVAVLAVLIIFRGVRSPLNQDTLLVSLLTPVTIKSGLGMAFGVTGVLCAMAALSRAKTMLFGSFWVFALGFALWFNWSHWVDLSHHWTQRDLFWRYYSARKEGEPITAFLMNWRGETFYSRNTVKQIKDNQKMYEYAAQPGREWALVEHNRLGILRGAVGPDKKVTVLSKPETNNKFLLVTID